MVHELYADPEVVAAVADLLGPGVRAADGGIDRGRVGERVFADPTMRRSLEEVLHPRIGSARRRWMERQAHREPPPVVIMCEVPLLFEVGLADQFDRVIVVSASEPLRRARVEARGQDFDQRAAAQWSEQRKIALADDVYMNDGTVGDLAGWAAAWWRVHAAVPPGDGG